MFSQQPQTDAPISEDKELDRGETNEETSEKVADPSLDIGDVTEEIDEDKVEASAFAERVNEDQSAYPDPVPFIAEVTQTGKVTIHFSEALDEFFTEVDLKNMKFEAEPGEWCPVLTVEIEPAQMQDPQNVAMEWSVISQSSSEIELQLAFEQPLYVSFEKEPDKLAIYFFYEDVFISANGIKIQLQN